MKNDIYDIYDDPANLMVGQLVKSFTIKSDRFNLLLNHVSNADFAMMVLRHLEDEFHSSWDHYELSIDNGSEEEILSKRGYYEVVNEAFLEAKKVLYNRFSEEAINEALENFYAIPTL
jgi:hypothetical protein